MSFDTRRIYRDGVFTSLSVLLQQTISLGDISQQTPVLGGLLYNVANNTVYYGNGVMWVALNMGSGSGVTSINGDTGAITLAEGTGISIVDSPTGTFTFQATGTSGVTSLKAGSGGTTRTGALEFDSGTHVSVSNTGQTFTFDLTGTPLPLSVGGTGEAALAAGVITSNAASLVSNTMNADGQLLIGSSAGAPGVQTISGTSGVIVTNNHNSITLSADSSALVTSVNGDHGAVTLTGGSNITITPSGNTLMFSVSGTLPQTIGGTGAGTLANFGVITSNGTSLISNQMTVNGQILIGAASSTAPSVGVITGSSGVVVTNGPNTIALSADPTGLVTSVNGDHGAVTLTGGSNITISPSGNTLMFSVSGTLPQTVGGTGAGTLADFGVITSNGTSLVSNPMTANGQLLIGAGSSTEPIVGVITGSSGVKVTNGPNTIALSADPTGVVTSVNGDVGAVTLTGGSNITISPSGNTLSFSVSGTLPQTVGGTGAGTLADFGVITSNGTSLVSNQMTTNGQLLIGSSSGEPAVGSLTAGPGISISPGPGSITLSVNAVGSINANGGTHETGNITLQSSSNISVTDTTGIFTISLVGPVPISLGGTGATVLADKGVITSIGTSLISNQMLFNGDLLIGSSSGEPAVATLTAGSGITVTNGSNSITISAVSPQPYIINRVTNGYQYFTNTISFSASTGLSIQTRFQIASPSATINGITFMNTPVDVTNNPLGLLLNTGPSLQFNIHGLTPALSNNIYSSVTANVWHNAAVTWASSGHVITYLDGVQVGATQTGVTGTPVCTPSVVQIGSNTGFPGDLLGYVSYTVIDPTQTWSQTDITSFATVSDPQTIVAAKTSADLFYLVTPIGLLVNNVFNTSTAGDSIASYYQLV